MLLLVVCALDKCEYGQNEQGDLCLGHNMKASSYDRRFWNDFFQKKL